MPLFFSSAHSFYSSHTDDRVCPPVKLCKSTSQVVRRRPFSKDYSLLNYDSATSQYKCDDSRLERVLQNRSAEGPLRCRLLALLPFYELPDPCNAMAPTLFRSYSVTETTTSAVWSATHPRTGRRQTVFHPRQSLMLPIHKNTEYSL